MEIEEKSYSSWSMKTERLVVSGERVITVRAEGLIGKDVRVNDGEIEKRSVCTSSANCLVRVVSYQSLSRKADATHPLLFSISTFYQSFKPLQVHFQESL